MKASRFNNIASTHQRGFTLVELLITLTIAAILISLASPSFSSMIKNNRIASQADELILSLNYARSEAISRGESVSLNSGSVNWHEGWTVDTGDGTTIRNYAALEGSTTLVGSASTLEYRGNGFFAGDGAITFTLCDDRENSTGRAISVSLTGRVENNNMLCNPA